ncbi:MAG: glycosyltransferase [Bacteroidota bacterium]|nr:glycosyltransferase [Bacteroidota bacterium]
MVNQSQIFQTQSETRWQRFKWSFRIIIFLSVIALTVLFITLKTLWEPDIPLGERAMKKVLTGAIPPYRQSNLAREYRGFRKAIDNRWAKGLGCGQMSNTLNLSTSPLFSDSLGIRAAFYVAWDPQSFTSLEKNISKINLVFPEWFLLDPTADTLYTTIDKKALQFMQKAGVKIMPILSNNYQSVFRGDVTHRILHNKAKKERLINDIVRLLTQYNFAGINIDWEELTETSNEPFTQFQKELYEKLHAQNLLVTQDVMPFNEDYDYKALTHYNDYLVLMAYDEHHDESKPGPICSQKWIEAAVDNMAKDVPPEKIILGMASYGYDWQLHAKKAETITYQEALVNARESDAVVDFDNDTYNLHYQYYDSNDSLHEVHFTDAATNFNTLRFATEYNLAGTALWRLGSEDSRVWDFYNKPMTKRALRHDFNFEDFNSVEAGFEPDYIGEGEILDIVSTPKPGRIRAEIDDQAWLISEEYYDTLPSTYVIRKWGKTDKKKVVLTFDDGPDPKYTPQILDTLAAYHVPAAFFLVGIQAENNIPLVKRILREGHEIGNHTFTHPNMAEVSTKRALLEMDATRLLIECITGRSTIMFRAPFNADSEPGKNEELIPVALSRTKNYITVGESIDPEDWQKGEIPGFNADTIFDRVVSIYNKRMRESTDTNDINGSIILLHDAGGDRRETVKATGRIIRFFQSKGYEFTTVANLLGKKPDDVMPPVPKGSGYALLQFNYVLAEIGSVSGHFIYALFLVFLTLSAIRIFVLGFLAIKQKRKEKLLNTAEDVLTANHPLVSIIVPAYNEEVNAVSSMQNLLKCDYPSFEIIFVDDGSKDKTYDNIFEAFKNEPKVKVFTKPNGGKASALNYGIMQSKADYVVCIDADTKLAPDAVRMLMMNFRDEQVGAVAGVVKVGNEVNMLTKWQSIEYTTSQNFDRKGFAYANAITVVPGAIGAFRKEALEKAGGFTTDTLAEDCDITIRILRAGYIVANEPKAYAYTEVPESLKQFFKQRFRWSFGVMQTFWKHKDTLFVSAYKNLGWVAMPDILLFKYVIPFFSPLGDLLMIFGLLTENRGKIFLYYLVFLLVDSLIAGLAFLFEKEKPWKLVWLIPQRLIYRWLMIAVLFKAFRRALKGELQHWGVLKRTGNVKDVAAIS